MSSLETPLWLVVGPTASGKTELALRLAEALEGEIVSADSVQVYRHFDIGTAKPSPAERAQAPHHLIDIAEPDQEMDAATWAKLADLAISDIAERGKRPIVCGGTFLWVKALWFGLAEAPPADPALRERHRQLVQSEGPVRLHEVLRRFDPVIASRLNPNDVVRVSRALEVFELTGTTMSAWQEQHGFATPRYSARLVGVTRSPEELTLRIAARTESMLQAGWVDEVRELIGKGYGSTRAMAAVGYRQVFQAVTCNAPINHAELSQEITRKTRVFARRQRTWLRDQPVTWVRDHELDEFVSTARLGA